MKGLYKVGLVKCVAEVRPNGRHGGKKDASVCFALSWSSAAYNTDLPNQLNHLFYASSPMAHTLQKEWRAAAKRVGHAYPDASALDSALRVYARSGRPTSAKSLCLI